MRECGAGHACAAQMLNRLWRGRDVGVVYAGLVVVSAVVLELLPPTTEARVIAQSSTNLVNLRSHPLFALGASAFVVSSPWSLCLVPLLVLAYGALQRWLGRLSAVVVGVLGHVGATLLVAVTLAAGIAHRLVDPGVALETDVGVSYGLVAVAGVCLFAMARRWRLIVGGLLGVRLAGGLVLGGTFTDLGHVCGFVIGLAMGWVARTAGHAVAPEPPA